MTSNIFRKIIYSIIIALFFVSGYVIGHFIKSVPTSQNEPGIYKITQNNNQLKYTKPLLAFEVGEKKEFLEYKPLIKEINQLLNDSSVKDSILDVSVYFRDLNNGRWTSINELDNFSPGSLLKVPLMIAYYKLAESNPSTLEKKLTYDGVEDSNTTEIIKPGKIIQKMVSYTIDELIRRIIVYSDNNATFLLFDNINKDYLNDVFSDLGISYNENKDTQDFLDTKEYSLFFRVLYNSTYLNSIMSEKALALSSSVDFNDGIKGGLPQNIELAHKFGEREYVPFGSNVIIITELHDCGIIYNQKSPYLLCIMTKGRGQILNKLSQLMRNISALVYNEVINDYNFTH